MRVLQIPSLGFAFECNYRIYDTLKARNPHAYRQNKRPTIQNRRSFNGTSVHKDKLAKPHEINVLRHQADDYYIKAAIQSIFTAKISKQKAE